jgi:hypothetical protein
VSRALLVGLAACVLAAGCGGGSSSKPARAPARPAPRAGDVSVIRQWADTLRAGDTAGAARLFGVPVIVENGTPPQLLRSRGAVRAFNESLPCGARLLGTRRRDRYTIATFRLTNRPGGACGAGVGGTAATAFRLRGGRIVEWLRVPVGPGEPTPPTPPRLAPRTTVS